MIQLQRLERRNDRPLNLTVRVDGTNHPSPQPWGKGGHDAKITIEGFKLPVFDE